MFQINWIWFYNLLKACKNNRLKIKNTLGFNSKICNNKLKVYKLTNRKDQI